MDDLNALVTAIRSSAKYRHVSSDVIGSIGRKELAKRRSLTEAIQATRSKLHQIGGAYFGQTQHYTAWLTELQTAAQAGDPERLRQICARIMTQHASTRERLPILDHFYQDILSDLAPIQSVLDLACGYNPLAIPWMPLAPGATYYAYDIYEDLMSFLNSFITLCGHAPVVGAQSILDTYPVVPGVHLALLLKAVPCLEQVDKTAGSTLLDKVDAQFILISYPAQSLGGRSKGMAANYAARFMELTADKGWTVAKYTFSTELAFVLQKTPER